MRFKLALTESVPVIKAYNEDSWAELSDSRTAPVEMALEMLRGVHARWVYLMRNMTEEDFAKIFFHPERGRIFSLDHTLGIYAWHSRHHVAHITSLRQRMGW